MIGLEFELNEKDLFRSKKSNIDKLIIKFNKMIKIRFGFGFTLCEWS